MNKERISEMIQDQDIYDIIMMMIAFVSTSSATRKVAKINIENGEVIIEANDDLDNDEENKKGFIVLFWLEKGDDVFDPDESDVFNNSSMVDDYDDFMNHHDAMKHFQEHYEKYEKEYEEEYWDNFASSQYLDWYMIHEQINDIEG